MTVDPGTKTTGWAIFIKGVPEFHGIAKSNRDTWIENVNCIVTMMDEVFWTYAKFLIKTVIIELPEYWQGIEGSSARESGSISKLYFLCGAFSEKFRSAAEIQFISPSRWKGQLKKEHVRQRVIDRIPKLKSVNDHNEMDAVGMGVLYILKENYDKN